MKNNILKIIAFVFMIFTFIFAKINVSDKYLTAVGIMAWICLIMSILLYVISLILDKKRKKLFKDKKTFTLFIVSCIIIILLLVSLIIKL